MFKFLSPLTSLVTGVLSSWTGYLVIAVALMSLGFYGGFQLEEWRASSLISSVQSQYDQYRILILKDVADTNTKSLKEIQDKSSQIVVLTNQLQKQLKMQQKDSQSISQSLMNSTLSNPLSQPVVDYLDKLKHLQEMQDHH